MLSLKLFLLFIISLASLGCFGSINSSLFQGEPIELSENQVEFLEAEKLPEIGDVLKITSDSLYQWKKTETLNFGYGPKPKWFRFEVNNTHDDFTVKYLFPMMQTAKLYLVQDGKVIDYKFGGKKFNFDVYRGLTIESRLKGTQSFYIYLESSGPYQVPITIGRNDLIHKEITSEYLLLGTWLGLIAALMIYYFIIYLKLHDPIYLYFSLYGVPLILINLSFSGVFYQYFPDFHPYLKSRLVIVSIGLMLVFLSLFTKSFFEISKENRLPKFLTRTMSACIFVPLALALINLINYTTFTISMTGLLGIVVPLLLITIAFYMIIKRRSGSYLYVVATGSFLVGFIVYCLKDFAILPNNHFTSYSIFYTSALEMMLLSFAIANKFRDIQIKNEGLIKTVILKEKSSELASLANQVAHDIRSPLEMLKGIKEDTALLPEGSRRRIQLGINRIEEIAFNLLKANKEEKVTSDQNESQELLGLVVSIVTEKKIEYRNNENVEIQDLLNSESFGLFSRLNRGKIKSIISNLINNSIESFQSNPGTVEIRLFGDGHFNHIEIKDNGPGIPSDVASKLFTKGFTTKKLGNGLGLFNAKKDIEAAGGSLTFSTKEGEGTTFRISIPGSEAPATFVSSIDSTKYERIIVLDDDPAFHEVWSKRLEGLESKVEHIYSVEEMNSKYHALHPKILLLSDFELMDKEDDGIDTIIKLNHAAHSVLVTARNEELEIQDRCLKAGIKLLPKSLVNYVRVIKDHSVSSQAQLKSAGMVGDSAGFTLKSDSSSSSSSLKAKLEQVEGSQDDKGEAYAGKYVADESSRSSDAQIVSNQPLVILIDDDKLVRYNWSSHCEKKGIPFKAFVSIDSFLDEAVSIPKEAKIYIDSNLGNDVKGEIESEKIFNLGFKNLYLATGYGKEYIKKPDWIIEIFSKSPEIASKALEKT